jgi:hypothetical protein
MANRWPGHFARDLDDIVEHGCTYLVHTLSENDMVYLRKTMAKFFQMTRDAGLDCWADPWGLLGLFGGEAFSAYVPRHPQDCQVLNTGQRAPAACPSAEGTRAAVKQWVDFGLDAGADTLFWDEPHLFIPDWDELGTAPDDAWSCRCRHCQDRFQGEFGGPMPEELTPEVHAFRQNLLLDFLGEMTAYTQAKGARNAICLLPAAEDSSRGLPWDRAAALPGVAIFGTDPYWRSRKLDPAEFVAEQTRKVVAVCKPLSIRPHIWVQAFGLPWGGEHEVEVALRTAATEGATVLAAWGYRAFEPFDIASERPDIVWDLVGRTYRALTRHALRE